MTQFAPCPACNRHVTTDEAECPFCAATQPGSFWLRAPLPASPGRLSRAAMLAAGAALLGACASSKTED